jgi:hypothetical protein
VFLSAVVLVAAVVTTVSVIALNRGNAVAAPAPSGSTAANSTPSPATTPLTASQRLLETTDDPNACAVSFEGDGVADEPMLQTQGLLYTGLPIPQREGLVFAGWYATPTDAAAFAIASRINGSELVACTDRQVTLHGSWKTPEENLAENARVPILMYHQFTQNPQGEDNALRGNYAYIGDFDAHMNHIATGGFSLPTWDELSAFIDGRLWLPTHSVIITDDDADATWLSLAVPVVDQYALMTTSFVITKWRTDATPSRFVLQRSHTQDMHEAGADGKGRMVNWTADEIAADLEASAAVLGAKEVVAYPFGHYNETTKQGVKEAGFELGRTIEPGYVTIGTDKLALPVIRINYGMNVDAVAGLIG